MFSDGRAYTKVQTFRSTIQQDDTTSEKVMTNITPASNTEFFGKDSFVPLGVVEGCQ